MEKDASPSHDARSLRTPWMRHRGHQGPAGVRGTMYLGAQTEGKSRAPRRIKRRLATHPGPLGVGGRHLALLSGKGRLLEKMVAICKFCIRRWKYSGTSQQTGDKCSDDIVRKPRIKSCCGGMPLAPAVCLWRRLYRKGGERRRGWTAGKSEWSRDDRGEWWTIGPRART